ncbi:membrane protein [Erwinia mallotivora]|uniref:Membrane protein n=2 Tax=Erwinia mallotivora TaxID=69222 RepID=A0A014NS93_9GAMM|nr:membrane protein [Erwinia mallotivora]
MMTRFPFSLPVLLAVLLMAGCSSSQKLPDFTASGYLADRGAVRIWRKEGSARSSHLITVYTPFSGTATETTTYQWQQNKLLSIERHTGGEHPESVMMRFQDDKLSFMQRQLEGRREALSADAVALYQFDAGRMLRISDDLLAGRVMLKQGHWSADGTVTLCQGSQTRPAFDRFSLHYITQHQQASGKPVSLSWLEAPKGTQLLLVSTENICATEPKAADL